MDPLKLAVMEPDCLVRTPPGGRLAKSVANFGIYTPVLLNCNNLVLDGKKRLEVAIRVGMKTIPARRLNEPITLNECQEVRAIMNPESKPKHGFRDIFAGKYFRVPVKKNLERAKITVAARSQNDMRLQKENKIYEASLSQAALHAVDSIGCLDAIMRNTKGRQDYLEKARKFLEKAIRYIVYSGFAKEKNVVSRDHEPSTKDANEKENSGPQSQGAGLLESDEISGDLRHDMRGFGAFSRL